MGYLNSLAFFMPVKPLVPHLDGATQWYLITRPREPMEPREPLEQHWVWMKVVKLQNSCFTWKVSFFFLYDCIYNITIYIICLIVVSRVWFSVWTTCPTPHERSRTSWWWTCGPIAIRPKGPMQWPVLSYTSKCFVTQLKNWCFYQLFEDIPHFRDVIHVIRLVRDVSFVNRIP